MARGGSYKRGEFGNINAVVIFFAGHICDDSFEIRLHFGMELFD
jgi:hypothetical protein